MFGFHRNKPIGLGLVPSTRGLLRRVEQGGEPLDYLPTSKPEKKSYIGPSGFLKFHTSTTEWEDFRSMLARAQVLDYDIFENSLSTILSHSVKLGLFEVRREIGCRAVYRRIERPPVVEDKRKNNGRKPRKVTQQDW